MKRYVLYIDESGSGNLADYSQNLLLTGVLIEKNDDFKISAYFNYIKKIYKLSDDVPFHSYDLFENPKSKSYLPPNKARKIIGSLKEFVKIIPIKVSIHYIDKKSLRSFFDMKEKEKGYFFGSEEAKRWKDIPYEMLASKMFFWFANHINHEKNCRGAIVAESRKESDHALLRSYLRCKTPSQYHSKNMKTCSEKMQKRISSIRFEEKIGFRPGLEIADLFSYVAYQYINKKLKEKRFKERDFNPFWKTIKNKIDSKKINVANSHTFKAHISTDRANKISNKVNAVNNPLSPLV